MLSKLERSFVFFKGRLRLYPLLISSILYFLVLNFIGDVSFTMSLIIKPLRLGFYLNKIKFLFKIHLISSFVRKYCYSWLIFIMFAIFCFFSYSPLIKYFLYTYNIIERVDTNLEFQVVITIYRDVRVFSINLR